MKRVIAAAMLGMFLVTGCTGSFQLTRKVYHLHRSQPDKWVDEIIFLGVVIIPIYGIATLADAIVFNSIEFWTGDNPVTARNGATPVRTVTQEGATATVTLLPDGERIAIDGMNARREAVSLVLERTEGGVIARDAQGNILWTSVTGEDGSLTVYDAAQKPVQSYSAEKVQMARNHYLSR